MIGLFNPFVNLGIQTPTIATPTVRLPAGFGYNYVSGPVAPTTVPVTTASRPVNYAPLPPVTFGTAPQIRIPTQTVIPTVPKPAVAPTNPLPNQTFNWAQPTGTPFVQTAPLPGQTFNWGFNPTGQPSLIAANTPAKTPVSTAKTK